MNYQAAPVQPILQGLVSFSEAGAPSFYGRGCEAISVDASGTTLTLDSGLPGSVAVDPDYARTIVTLRGTTIDSKTISYPTETTIKVFLAAAGVATFVDFEIIVLRADAGVDRNATSPVIV